MTTSEDQILVRRIVGGVAEAGTHLRVGDHAGEHELGESDDSSGGDLRLLLLETVVKEAKDDVGLTGRMGQRGLGRVPTSKATHAEASFCPEIDSVEDEHVKEGLENLDSKFSLCLLTLTSEKLERVERGGLRKIGARSASWSVLQAEVSANRPCPTATRAPSRRDPKREPRCPSA